jgi:hypothetical protein
MLLRTFQSRPGRERELILALQDAGTRMIQMEGLGQPDRVGEVRRRAAKSPHGRYVNTRLI